MTQKEYFRKRYEEEWKPAYNIFITLYPFTIANLDGEIWRPIPHYEEYYCSNFGRVKSCKFGREKILKPALDPQGHLFVNPSKNGKPKKFLIARLVARLFIANPDNLPEVKHLYSRFSNHVDCLAWATRAENIRYAFDLGLAKSGENHYKAKLTAEQIRYIRQNPDGLKLEQLAEKFNLAFQAISKIQLGGSYKNAGGTIRESKVKRVPDDKRAKILAAYQAGGITQLELAKMFAVSQTVVWKIVNKAAS